MVKLQLPRRSNKPKVKSPDDRMTIVEHLAELRSRLVKSLLAIGLGMIVVFVFYNQVLSFLRGPYQDVCNSHPKFQCTGDFLNTDPLGGFGTRMRIAGYGGLILALPVVLWQVWRFITPGLHPREKRYAIPFVATSMALFAFGAALAYWTLPKALEFLIAFAGKGVISNFTPNAYVRLVVLMMLAFGSGFLFPVVIVFLELVNILSPQQLSKWRRQAIVVIVVVAAVITPSGDPYSLIAMAVPMYIFYECSILIGYLIQRSRRRAAAKAAASASAAT
jgi:sec-independent protein translocase protein TatC